MNALPSSPGSDKSASDNMGTDRNVRPTAVLSLESLIAQVADEFTERLERGDAADVEEYARRYPEHESAIRQVLSSLKLIRLSKASLSGQDLVGGGALTQGRLGDYVLVRQVGQGGMGVVYEAEQISLGRRVALKVLPFAAALDARQLQRFKNEATAAAQLHHTNIVPVFGVGCERGVHFYAMQFIEGQTLAAVIQGLREPQVAAEAPAEPKGPSAPSGEPTRPCYPTPPVAVASTEKSTNTPAFFRTVANLGVQAAEALEHAHQLGIVHRDIKPANLLIDHSPLTTPHSPRLWITDFGLA